MYKQLLHMATDILQILDKFVGDHRRSNVMFVRAKQVSYNILSVPSNAAFELIALSGTIAESKLRAILWK